MIPGANILKTALSLIAPQTVSYYRAESRTTNSIGVQVTTYASPVSLSGSFQPVPKRFYTMYDLDFQKSYFTFYTSSNLVDLQRDVSSDQIIFNSKKYQCESDNDWFAIDGWKGVLCVYISS